MTKKQIKEEYTRIYRKYSKSAKYYKKKYDIDIKLPKKVKAPTIKSIERLESSMREQMLHAKSYAAYIRYHSTRRDQAAIRALYKAIDDGLKKVDDSWSRYKADTVWKLLDENIPDGGDEESKKKRKAIALHIEKNLVDLHDTINRFVTDSEEGFERKGRMVDYCWSIINEVVPEFAFVTWFVNNEDDFEYFDEETGEIYE